MKFVPWIFIFQWSQLVWLKECNWPTNTHLVGLRSIDLIQPKNSLRQCSSYWPINLTKPMWLVNQVCWQFQTASRFEVQPNGLPQPSLYRKPLNKLNRRLELASPIQFRQANLLWHNHVTISKYAKGNVTTRPGSYFALTAKGVWGMFPQDF